MENENNLDIEINGMAETAASVSDRAETVNDDVPGNGIYEHTTLDPHPPTKNADRDTRKEYLEKLDKYVKEWCDLYFGIAQLTPHTIWCDFTGDFSRKGLENLSGSQVLPTLVTNIRNVLLKHGIDVYQKRGYSKLKALIEC